MHSRVSLKRRRIYRRRRIVVAVAAVLVMALLVFCVYSLGRAVQSMALAIGRDSPVVSRSSVPDPKQTSGVRDCGADDVSLELAAAAPSVTVGGALNFTATISHKGLSRCLIDGSDDSRVLTIMSGSDTIWRSNVCSVDTRMLLMSQGDKDVQTIAWNADRTGGTCVSDSDLPKVNRGTYTARLSMRDNPAIASTRVPFIVN